MIYGIVNRLREATIPIVVSSANRQQQLIDTVIDTGFSGFLSLPSAILEDNLRSEYDLKRLRVRKLGAERKSFGGTVVRLDRRGRNFSECRCC